ncbi:unnamed protein product, partial [Prorocentrum cordatum]
GEPRIAARQQPFVRAKLAGVEKTSEYGEYFEDSPEGLLSDCPWRFCDTFTFTVKVQESMRFPPQPSDAPAAVPRARRRLRGPDHVQPGEPVGHMIVVFAVHSPPEVILRSLKPSPASQVSSIVSSPMGWVAGTSSKRQSAKPTKPKKKASVDAAAAVEKAEAMAQSGQYQELDVSPTAPELDMDGWECRKGPHGQTYWHHQAVGPAPWDAAAPKVSKPQAGTDLLAAAMRLVPK